MFQTGSGFSKLSRVETQIQEALANLPDEPTGHQPFVSKKKEARRKREEEARRLSELKDVELGQIEFTIPTRKTLKPEFDLTELEREMRQQLGLDVPASAPAVAAKPVAFAKPPSKPLRPMATPTPPPAPKPSKPQQIIKRQLEVLLQVRRPDGTEIPFYHCDTGISGCLAEMNAARKARSYGLQVVSTISITTKEYTCTL